MKITKKIVTPNYRSKYNTFKTFLQIVFEIFNNLNIRKIYNKYLQKFIFYLKIK